MFGGACWSWRKWHKGMYKEEEKPERPMGPYTFEIIEQILILDKNNSSKYKMRI